MYAPIQFDYRYKIGFSFINHSSHLLQSTRPTPLAEIFSGKRKQLIVFWVMFSSGGRAKNWHSIQSENSGTDSELMEYLFYKTSEDFLHQKPLSKYEKVPEGRWWSWHAFLLLPTIPPAAHASLLCHFPGARREPFIIATRRREMDGAVSGMWPAHISTMGRNLVHGMLFGMKHYVSTGQRDAFGVFT